MPLDRLPFPSIVVASTDDPYVTLERARQFAERWGSRLVTVADAGHINGQSGLGDWPAGFALLQELRRHDPDRAPLFPPFRQAALPGAVVVVVLRIDLPHRRLARALFVRVRDQAGQPRDQEDRVAELVGEPEIGADRRDRAVDVDRQRPAELRRSCASSARSAARISRTCSPSSSSSSAI